MQPPSCDIASGQQKSNVFIPVIVISTFFFLQFCTNLVLHQNRFSGLFHFVTYVNSGSGTDVLFEKWFWRAILTHSGNKGIFLVKFFLLFLSLYVCRLSCS